ncbi:hypothetical protein QYE76_066164 [Lolium multiflorum]|uniref:Uncharacterized protein n=1 Tax=Lolium multiflorum TaxID=4521 RepID=A0AAD8SAA9_LOLMU|nr:hypothetical protein QYE76_066164 [Lolium multiflorum]
MMANAWGKADVESSEIQLHKKEINDFFDHLLDQRKRRVTLGLADDVQVGKERIAELEKQLAEAQNASTSLTTASSELENLCSAYKYLETKMAEADKKREWAEKQLSDKKFELLQKKSDFVQKRQVDSKTIQQLQKDVNGLQNYMTTAEKGWDLLNADIMEPLGFNEERRNQFPRDDLIRLAGDDCKVLISPCREICHNLNIKGSRTCDINQLIKRMDMFPELVVDLQASSSWGAASHVIGHVPGAGSGGYDTRIARQIPHTEFYDKVVLPADELLEAEYAKEREAEARPVGSSDEGQVTWTSSKDRSKDGATSPATGVEDDDEEEDATSSPAKEAEDETAHAEDGVEEMTRAKKDGRAHQAADAVERPVCAAVRTARNAYAVSGEGPQLLLRPLGAAVVVQRVRPGRHRPQLLLPSSRWCARPPRRAVVAVALHDPLLLLLLLG